jgi:K+-transporting ATPase ATPase C chain
MNAHLRANLVLVGATLLLCSILYPLTVYGVGWVAFHDKSTGSLVKGPDGKPVGSELIAQEFKGAEYFQPRPSATSPAYNASASGASNLGSNNPKLRWQVAQRLGPVVRYNNGAHVGDDVLTWVAEKPDRLAEWAALYPKLAGGWINSDQATTNAVAQWMKDHDAPVAAWQEKHLDATDDEAFFAVFAAENAGKVPKLVGEKIEAVGGADVQGWFFDMWLQANPGKAANIKLVPADMVMTSGSGLDPHITLRNALYQLPDVAAGWKAKNDKLDEKQVAAEIERLLNEKKFKALGVAGEELVNALEVNLALRERYGPAAR